MKQFLIFCMCCYLILPSCMQTCVDAESSITLSGFTNNETDTIIVRKFAKSANFTTMLDTFFVTEANTSYNRINNTLHLFVSFDPDHGLSSGYDYEIYIPENNKLYQISEIVENYESKNTGCKKVRCINSIASYKINGKIIPAEDGYTIFIPK